MPHEVFPRVVGEPEGSVARLIYASEATFAGSAFTEMERIRDAAVRNNAPLHVCTALLYQSGWFVQWKEGPGESLQTLMERVSNDPRHREMRIVHASRGPRILHGPWSMTVVQAEDHPLEMAERVHRIRHDMNEGRQHSPPVVWRLLSTPRQHLGAAQQADPSAFQRVLACGASGPEASDLVHWLAERHSQPLMHRRLSGDHDLDVATDLVDFMQGDRPMRVISMARKGLQVPLARAFLSDYSHVLLLLSGNEERDGSLAEKVARACGHLEDPPLLVGIARSGQWHAAPLAVARREHMMYVACEAQSYRPEALWTAALDGGITLSLSNPTRARAA